MLQPSADLTATIEDGYLEGIVLKDRTDAYRSASQRGWSKVQSPERFERHWSRATYFGRPLLSCETKKVVFPEASFGRTWVMMHSRASPFLSFASNSPAAKAGS